MSSLNYDLKRGIELLTRDDRWNVLTILILHVNARNRCWPSMETIAKLGTNGNDKKASAAKKFLKAHQTFILVPYAKRVGDDETKLPKRQHIYELTGKIVPCGDPECECKVLDGEVPYLYLNTSANGEIFSPENFNGENGSISRLSDSDAGASDGQKRKRGRKPDELFNAIGRVWNTEAGGYIGKLKKQLTGNYPQKHKLAAYNIAPAATAQEVLDFGVWYAKECKKLNLPEAPDKIQKWFYQFRREFKPTLKIVVEKRETPSNADNYLVLDEDGNYIQHGSQVS